MWAGPPGMGAPPVSLCVAAGGKNSVFATSWTISGTHS
jgi:hypothetical protein